jgi:streptogramin lyase
MQTIRNLTGRGRFLAAAIALLMLTCGTPSHAWCANLWIAFYNGGGIESYKSGQLKKSGMPTPIHLSTFDSVTRLAFDKSHNLWAVVDDDEVVRFTPHQLKNLKHDPSPTPGVIITSPFTFKALAGCNFDPQGNLWVVDFDNDSIAELSKAQLAAGSGSVTPVVVITSSDLVEPSFVTFDKAGNAWVNDGGTGKLAGFSASQLMSGGSKSPTVLISNNGSYCTSLCAPGEIVFDQNGNLWVPNEDANTVVEYAKALLTSSGNPAPTVTLSSAIFNRPFGAVFDSKGNLLVMKYFSVTIAKFAASQLKVSGAPIPTVSVTGDQDNNYQIIFGPSS